MRVSIRVHGRRDIEMIMDSMKGVKMRWKSSTTGKAKAQQTSTRKGEEKSMAPSCVHSTGSGTPDPVKKWGNGEDGDIV